MEWLFFEDGNDDGNGGRCWGVQNICLPNFGSLRDVGDVGWKLKAGGTVGR